MWEQIETRLSELARRAGLAGTPPMVVAAGLGVCAVVICVAAWRWWPRESALGTTSAVAGTLAGPQGEATAEASAGPNGIGGGAGSEVATQTATAFVHVVGAVRRPGMYELAADARVADAIDAAGGALANAAPAGVNLARAVADGEQIVVPTADEFASGGGAAAQGSQVPAPAGAGGAGISAAGALVNINTADAAALDTLPGVGPSTAAKIVSDREANGPFASPDDLGRVAGIGPKKLEELKPRVCVR